MNSIPLPTRCLTLLPPWPQAIRYAEKRLENRSRGVAEPLAHWRHGLGLTNVPVIGLSQSKGYKAPTKDGNGWTVEDADDAARDIENGHVNGNTLPGALREFSLGFAKDWLRTAAKLWLCAELLDVLPPDRCKGDPWHVSGQWGLIFGRVWEVKPVPCMGGQGAWRSQWCVACKKIVADSHGLTCKTCRSTLVSGPECPALEIVTEVL